MAADGALSPKERKAILDQLRELQASENISNARIAKMAGIKASTFSRVVRGEYSGNTDKYLRRVRSMLHRLTNKVDVPETDYVSTSVGEQILVACQMALHPPCIGIVKAPSGGGKTAALAEMARSLTQSHCAYISAGQVCSSTRELLVELAARLGMSPRSRFTSAQLYRDVRDKLAERYQGGRNQSYMIIIDEATTLRASAINMLRNLHDDPACRPAIILADTVSRLDGFLYSRAGIAGGNEQLRSRAKAQFIRDADARFGWTVDARGRDVRNLTDVKLVADATLGQLGFDGKLNVHAYTFLHELANQPGALRNVTARLQAVWYFAQQAKCRPEFTRPQLDFLGELSGMQTEGQYERPPFVKVA